jgi:ketosteroid isomerase-like protein
MQAVPESLKNWLRLFSQAVRDRNLTEGKNLFDENVVSFGTVCFRVESLDDLAARQWQLIWPKTKKFEFDYDSARAIVDANLAVIMADWSSTGFNSDNLPFPRRGRATIALKKSASAWKAVHTHFSMDPAQK